MGGVQANKRKQPLKHDKGIRLQESKIIVQFKKFRDLKKNQYSKAKNIFYFHHMGNLVAVQFLALHNSEDQFIDGEV